MELIKIDTEMVKSFNVNLLDVQKMVDEYQQLTLTPDDKESYQTCRKALTVCVRNRRAIDERRLELNKEDQEKIKKRNGVAKQLTDLIAPAEDHLTELIKGEDKRIAEIKAEKARKEQKRVDEIREKINDINSLTASLHLQPNIAELDKLLGKLESMKITPEVFQEFTQEANESKQEVRIVLLKAIDSRREFERKEEALRAENERIEKEKAELEAQKKAQAEAQAKIDAENQRIEREKIEKEAKEKAEQELKEKLEREQKEKEEAERQAEIERQRKEALKPDKEKLIAWLNEIENVLIPPMTISKLNNSNAIDAFRSILEKGREFVQFAKNRIEEL